MSNPARLIIIADDITGACDTAIQFRKHGLSSIVLRSLKDIETAVNEVDVVVFDTGSRNDSPAKAYAKVVSVTKAVKETGIRIFYKKVDSTLRGNIGQEIDAIMDKAGIEFAVVAPAYPANRRITVGGYHLVERVPLGESQFSHDFMNPVTESHIPTLLANQSKRQIGYIGLSTVMKGSMSLKAEINNQIRKENKIVVFDATLPSHLRAIAEASASLGIELYCGSAGFAEELSRVVGLTSNKPVMVICGSLNEVTRKQVLRAKTDLKCNVIELDVPMILYDGKAKYEELAKVARLAHDSLKENEDLIISTVNLDDPRIQTDTNATTRAENREAGRLISATLGELVKELLGNGVSGLVLTGGDTAADVFESIGIMRITVENEVCPGIPCNKVIGGRFAGLRVITKAGGFGDENAIVECIRFLKGGS